VVFDFFLDFATQQTMTPTQMLLGRWSNREKEQEEFLLLSLLFVSDFDSGCILATELVEERRNAGSD
jgi:hypothetical protein